MRETYKVVLSKYLKNIVQDEDAIIYGEYEASNGKIMKIKIELPELFPITLPNIVIVNKEELKLFLPHIEKNGVVCYSRSDNVLFDIKNPGKLVESACIRAIETIEMGISGLNHNDFRKEFVAFWDSQDGMQSINFFGTVDKNIKRLNLFIGESEKHSIICDQEKNNSLPESVNRFFSGAIKHNDNIEVLYIPLRSNNILPPNPELGWERKEILKSITENLTQSNKKFFRRWISQKNNKANILIIDIPIEKENNVIIGYFIDSKKTLLKSYKGKFIPLLINRLDLDYMLERTSGERKFVGTNICMIGVGSVGSKLAVELSDLGISNMTLIDSDVFSKDNLYRHSLGASSLIDNKRNNKVDELAKKIERDSPYVSINCESMNVLQVVSKATNFFEKFDYIFVSIGDTMTSLKLNTIFSKSTSKVFYSWVEPFGIGGHSLYIDYSKKGCYQCLYTNPINGELVLNRASLAEEGQHFERSMASCRSSFIPYGSLTSSYSAVNTTDLFQRVVYDKVEKNSLKTWLGDTAIFLNFKYRLSNYYELVKNKDELQVDFKNSECEICRRKNDNLQK